MTTQQIQYIIALAEEGSFSKAAKKLFVTQPSISQLIKNMETQLNAPLFDRSSSPIRLTAIGQAYYEAAKKIQSTERELANRVCEINELKTGSLRVGTTPFRASYMLPKNMAAFKKAFPSIEFNIITTSINELKQLLLTGEIDICIEEDVFDSELFYSEVLTVERCYLAAGKDCEFNKTHREQQLKETDIASGSRRLRDVAEISLDECRSEPFIVLDTPNNDSDIAARLLPADGTFHACTIETMFHWITHNLGIGILPDTLIHFGNFKEHPFYYKIKEPRGHLGSTKRKIVAAYTKKRILPPAAPAYIDLLKQQFTPET